MQMIPMSFSQLLTGIMYHLHGFCNSINDYSLGCLSCDITFPNIIFQLQACKAPETHTAFPADSTAISTGKP
jgi:hypothetical protein